MDLSELETARLGAQHVFLHPPGLGTTGTGNVNALTSNVGVFSAPGTSGAAFTKASTGALSFNDAAARWMIAHLDFTGAASTTAREGGMIIADRLWGCSGYSGTDTASKTITTSLPRGSGAGVMVFAEIYSALGSTPQDITVTYTNQDGTGSRTGTISLPASIPAGSYVPMQMQAGDYGVNSVQSFQLGGSTGTVGDYGLTLVRFSIISASSIPKPTVVGWMQTAMVGFDNDAALQWLSCNPASSIARPIGYMQVVE